MATTEDGDCVCTSGEIEAVIEDKSAESKRSICSWGSFSILPNVVEEPSAPPPKSDSLEALFDANVDGEEAPESVENAMLVSAPVGSRNAVLLFRSSALADGDAFAVKEKPAYKLHVTYKVLQAETKLLSKMLDCHGVCEVAPNSSDFNLLWTGSHPKPGTLRALAPHQRVNHFPRSYELTRKDRLYKNIERMQHLKGFKNFDFIPQTFIMPIEYRDLCQAHQRCRGPWIVKPVASSRGRGIFIVEIPNQVPLEEPVVVAKYISNPLLVAGHKCDLRLYVAVTSFDPLLVYIYEEGLVRFATVKYDSSHKQLWNPCMHLCNYSINKYHSDYVKSDDPSAENVGHKWTLSALLRHLKSEGKDTTRLMAQIEDVVIKAILAPANSIVAACKMFVPNQQNCFELYGFDILIDNTLKPWLLEVNLSPSLNCDSPLDVRLKSAMLADLLSLIGIPAVNPMTMVPPAIVDGVKLKLRARSVDGFHHIHNQLSNCHKLRKPSSRITNASLPSVTTEESKMIKMAAGQFERRGGFIRIFPAVDTWAKYSHYLDPHSGIPTAGATTSSNYINTTNHNYNLLLHRTFYPDECAFAEKPQISFRQRELDARLGRSPPSRSYEIAGRNQDRYERMLSQGHRQTIGSCKMARESQLIELKKKILDLLRAGKRISQNEARKTFSLYLVKILKRIACSPEQGAHVEVVLNFLQKASNYLRTPFTVAIPSSKLSSKDRTAFVAKQLNDFLYLYNRETDMFVDKNEKPSQIPAKMYQDFLEYARESDLEEVLIFQTSLSRPVYATGFKGMLRCMPTSPMKAYTSRKLAGKFSKTKRTGTFQ